MEPNEIVRAPMVHELKCWPEYYEAVESGEKPFEVRKWDRPYRVGDTLLLKEFDQKNLDYTGRQTIRKITYLLDMTYLPGENIPHFARYVVLGLEDSRLRDCIERLQAEMEERERNYRIGVNVGAYTIKRLQAELEASQRRERAAVEILNSIDWVGSGAKERIEDAIGILRGPEQEVEALDG